MNLYNNTDVGRKVKSLWDKARAYQSDWRTLAKEDFNFPAGHQWDENDMAKLKDQGRPIVTFNRCNAILSAILGMEANQRQKTAYLPRERNDTGLSNAIEQITNWTREYGGTEVEEAQAFEDMLTCGMGWVDTYIDYDTDFDGRIIQEVTNPLEMAWDIGARKRNLTDAEWVAHGKRMSGGEIKERWPDAQIDISEDALMDETTDGEIKFTNPAERYTEEEKGGDTQDGRHTVIRMQWHERTPVYRVAMPMSGQIHEIPEAKFKKLKQMLDTNGARYIKQFKRTYYQAFVVGDTLLEKAEAPCQTGFSLKCITGKRDKINNQWYGIVRVMKDPQRWANKFFSTFIDIIDSNSKGGVMIEENAVADIRKFEENWAKADSVIWVRQGTIATGRIREKPSSQYPQAVDRLLQFAIQSIYDVTGVNMEMLGLADRAQPGILEESRKRSAYTILAPFFDSLRAYRKESGILVLEYIKNYIPRERLEEVLENDLKPYAEVIKQIDLRQVNITVAESPQSDNHKMLVWGFISQVVPQLASMGIPIPPEILEYSPLPAPLIEKWKSILPGGKEGGPQIPPEIQQQIMKMQEMVKKLQEENMKLKTGEQAKLAELALKRDISREEMAIEREKIQGEFAMKQEELRMKMEQFMIELKTKVESEMTQTHHELNAKKEMHALSVQAKQPQ